MPRYTERRQAAIWNGRVQGMEQRSIALFASSCIFMSRAPIGSTPFTPGHRRKLDIGASGEMHGDHESSERE
ncbi:hypothetical protein [Sorangium sp. So ce385]|uniref:hypothetical protein n=1 Tax=Sorangium sp. So ce385 TaxID=3133308 RepID=UPI003F5BCE62